MRIGKSRLWAITFWLVAVLFFSVAMSVRENPKATFLNKHAALVVREIGHRILLHAGDSTSRVLPVRQQGNLFELEFQNHFSFSPDTLVHLVKTGLAANDLPLYYIVNVLDCRTHEVVYGFEILPTRQEVVPCLGRVQPRGCYTVQIDFYDLNSSSTSHYYYFSLVALAGIVLIVFTGRSRDKRSLVNVESKLPIRIGKYEFDVDRKLLVHGSETISLSHKEAKVLSILSQNKNEPVPREQLLKEVWEDEGVFTGRSLDMFISKLRKKLSGDENVKITNIHGVGYRLEG
jgi:hypothetical protein